MSWGTERRNTIVFAVFLLIAIPTVLYFIIFKYEAPTCSDGKRNGSETGVDCGGACALICAGQGIDPYVRWTRYFQVAPGVYNAVAYVENQNADAGSADFAYTFTMYDIEGAIIAQRSGTTRLHPKEMKPIVQNAVSTGKALPVRINFEISQPITWQREDGKDNVIIVERESVFETDASTKITARLSNISLSSVRNVAAVIILYDKNGNAIGVSSTFTEEVPANGSRDILFTWPRTFNGQISRFEIAPLYESN